MPYTKRPVADGKQLCSRCEEWKLLSDFSLDKKNASGRQSICRSCAAACARKRYSSDARSFLRKAASTHRNSKWPYQSQRRRKLVAESCITAEFLIDLWEKQGGRCAITGEQMTHSFGEGYIRTNVSIDRIDSSVGYVPGNVQLVCRAINEMKVDMDIEEFGRWCTLAMEGPQLRQTQLKG